MRFVCVLAEKLHLPRTLRYRDREGVRGDVRVANNNQLSTLNLPTLVVVDGNFEAQSNQNLCQQDVTAIVDGLTGYDGTTVNSGNLDCP